MLFPLPPLFVQPDPSQNTCDLLGDTPGQVDLLSREPVSLSGLQPQPPYKGRLFVRRPLDFEATDVGISWSRFQVCPLGDVVDVAHGDA